MAELHRTALYALHAQLGARMVEFAGFEMPVQYSEGVKAEHLHTRAAAGLFDVSHMGQVRLSAGNWDTVALAFETLVPQDVLGLADGRQRYGFFTNPAGGIEDDLMFAREGDDLIVVVNAARKAFGFAHLASLSGITVAPLENHALIALQGPGTEAVIAGLDPQAEEMLFMDRTTLDLGGCKVWATRSGYTGEDGFEISVPNAQAADLAQALLDNAAVKPVGLGARDSLRLEAGLCLYGQDIDTRTTPLEADLGWAMQRARKPGGARTGGFPGADALAAAPKRKRVGLLPDGGAPMRTGVTLYTESGEEVGQVTSGGFGPSLDAPMSMGYVRADLAEPGTPLLGDVRGKRRPLKVSNLPFVPARFKRKKKELTA